MTLSFFAEKDFNKVERALCSDMERLSEWFIENKLLLNLKPGKTELLVFGTNQQLPKIPRNLKVIHNHQVVNITNLYRHLGVELTGSLNLNSHFHRRYHLDYKYYIASDTF